MNEATTRKFNILCRWLEQRNMLHAFQHALHCTMFPGRTHIPSYNIIHALQSSREDDWHKAAELIAGHTFTSNFCTQFDCKVREQVYQLAGTER